MIMLIRALLAGLLALALGGCQTAPTINYEGPDAGYVVAGIGMRSGIQRGPVFSLYVRRLGDVVTKETIHRATFAFDSENLLLPESYYDYNSTAELGVVRTIALKPGKYEFYNFEIFDSGAYSKISMRAGRDFSVPFTVEAGKTVYLGNYQVNLQGGERSITGARLNASYVFLVSDRLKDDMALALKKKPGLPTEGTDITPNTVNWGFPYFVSKAPPDVP